MSMKMCRNIKNNLNSEKPWMEWEYVHYMIFSTHCVYGVGVELSEEVHEDKTFEVSGADDDVVSGLCISNRII